MKKLITANDIREAHARGEQAMSVVLRASIITPEARKVADLLGFTITECDESIPVTASVPASVPADKTESQRIRETIIAQLPEGQFTESLVAQLMEKVMKEKQSLEQGAMQPSFKSVTGKGGIKVIDGSSVKFGRFDGAQPHCVGLTDLVTGDDGSSMAAGFMQWENAFFPWTLNYDEIDMVLEGELHVRHEGETMIAKAGDVMFIPKGSSIESKAIRVWVFARFSTAPLRWQCGCKLNWRNRGSRGWRISVRVLATLCAPMRWGNRWAARRLSGFLTKICIDFLTSRCAISTTIIWCRKPATGAMRRCSICYVPKCGKPKP